MSFILYFFKLDLGYSSQLNMIKDKVSSTSLVNV